MVVARGSSSRWIGVVVAFSVLALTASTGKAASEINVGVKKLLPHTPGQTIQLLAVPGATVDQVTGFNLRAQLGDGLGPQPEPQFTSVDFQTQSIWNAPFTVLGGPVAGAPQYAQASVVFNQSGVASAASGLVVTVTVDTSGLMNGQYDFKLNATDIGFPSVFIGQGGVDVPVSIVNGVIDLSGALCGDLNLDGDVDSDDLLNVLSNFTGAQEPGEGSSRFLDGDCDADLDVDSADMLTFLESWTGAVGASGMVLAATQPQLMVIPEPGTIALMVLGLALTLLGRRRQR
ncbi:MAG: PEP-CTERM sorting domain-containing protein [Pirellulales bacterium]